MTYNLKDMPSHAFAIMAVASDPEKAERFATPASGNSTLY